MIGRLLIRGIANFVAVLLAGTLIPRYVSYDPENLAGVVAFAVVLALLNMFVKPLLTLLTAPITCLTLGLFVLVINALLFWLAAQLTSEAVHVQGPLGALFGSLLVSAVSLVVARLT